MAPLPTSTAHRSNDSWYLIAALVLTAITAGTVTLDQFRMLGAGGEALGALEDPAWYTLLGQLVVAGVAIMALAVSAWRRPPNADLLLLALAVGFLAGAIADASISAGSIEMFRDQTDRLAQMPAGGAVADEQVAVLRERLLMPAYASLSSAILTGLTAVGIGSLVMLHRVRRQGRRGRTAPATAAAARPRSVSVAAGGVLGCAAAVGVTALLTADPDGSALLSPYAVVAVTLVAGVLAAHGIVTGRSWAPPAVLAVAAWNLGHVLIRDLAPGGDVPGPRPGFETLVAGVALVVVIVLTRHPDVRGWCRRRPGLTGADQG